MAAANGHLPVMAALLAAGADVNAVNARGNSALHWAVFTSQEAAVTALVPSASRVSHAGVLVPTLKQVYHHVRSDKEQVETHRLAPVLAASTHRR